MDDLNLDQAIDSLHQQKQLDDKSNVIGKPIQANHIGDYGLPALPGADRASILRTPGDEGTQFDNGYVQDIPLEDYRASNQSPINRLYTGFDRLAGSTILKAAEGISTLVSGVGVGVADLAIGAKNLVSDKKSDYLGFDDVTNNKLNDIFYGMEDWWKKTDPVYKPRGYDNLNFGQQLATTQWWADEGADAFAYALSNFIPAGAIGKLGLGAKAASLLGAGMEIAEDGSIASRGLFSTAEKVGAKLGKMGKLGETANELLLNKSGLSNPVNFAKNLDLLTQNAFMTSSEALSEAKQTGETITQNYLQKKNKQDISELTPEESKELNDVKSTSMQATFWANVGALYFSNRIEAGLLNKAFGNVEEHEIGKLINLGDGFDAASKVERKGVQRFLLDTKVGAVLRNIPKYALVEGLYEENIQNAIQNVSTKFGHEGKWDYLKDVVKGSIEDLSDKEAWKSIGAGMVIGAIMGSVGSAREHGEQQKAVGHAINNINQSRENFVNLNNSLYEKNEDGSIKIDDENKPVYNTQAISDYAANTNQAKDLADLHDMFKTAGNDNVAKILRDEAFTKYALAHLEAGLGDEFQAKIKALSSYKEEDLAKQGFDPIEIKNGEKVSVTQRAQELSNQASQIQKDFDLVSKTVQLQEIYPTALENENLRNARVNEAVKNLSRIRTLDNIISNLDTNITRLKANSITTGESPIVTSINNQARDLEAKKQSFQEGITNGSIKPENQKTRQLLAEMVNLEQAVKELKSSNKEELESLGHTVSDDSSEITDSNSEAPDTEELKKNLKDKEDARISKLGLLDRYNSITNFKNGAQNFISGIANKASRDIQQENQQEDEDNTSASELSQYKEGDFVEYGDKENPQRGYVTPDEKGNLTVNSQVLSKGFLNRNPNLRKYTSEELQQYKDNKLKEFRKSQIQDRINKVNSRLSALEANIEGKNKEILESVASREDLLLNKQNSTLRVSERTLNRQIKSINDAISKLTNEIRELDNQRQDYQQKLQALQDDLQNGSIEDNTELIDTYNNRSKEIDDTINENNSIIDKLKKNLEVLQKLWKKAFPNKEANQDNYLYASHKVDINLTKNEIKELEDSIDSLAEEKTQLQAKVNFLESELADYQLQANKLEYNPVADKPETTTDDPETPNNTGKDSFEKDAKPDIVTQLFKTAGNHRTSEKNGLTENHSQKVWYKFAEDFDPKNKEGIALRTVTIDDEIYGKGKDQDLFREEPEQYQTKDNIKVLAVDKNGEPIHRDGSLVYTSLPEINENRTKLSDFPAFRSSNDALNKQAIEQYRAFAEIVKKSSKPVILKITSKSNGVIVPTEEPVSAKEAFGTNPTLNIITDKETTIGGTDYKLPQGLVYVNYNSRPVQAETRTLSPIESKAVLDKLKQYAESRGNSESTDSGRLLQQIQGTIALVQRKNNPEYSIYFVKGKNQLVFGDKIINTEDLISGKYDQQLREFLDNQNLQISKSLLTKNEEFTDIHDKKWKSYSDYLLTKRDDTPLLFKIKPKSDNINEPQFYNTYLEFSSPKLTNKEPAPQQAASTQQSANYQDSNKLPFITIGSLDEIATVKEQIKPQVEEIELPDEEESSIQPDLLDDLFLHKEDVFDYKQANLEEEKQWFNKNISKDISYEVVKELIDKKAYGKFSRAGKVLISDIAIEGTTYHEAFHVVSQLYLTDKERSSLYQNYKTENNQQDLEDNKVEEALAEEFREYALTRQSPYKSFFDKIYNFIKGLLGIGNDNKQLLFSRINNGYFKDSNIKSNSDLDLYKMSDHLDASTTKDLLDSMTLTLVRGLFKNNFSLNDIERFNNGLLNEEDTKRFKNLYSSVLSTVTGRMEQANQPNSEFLKSVADYINSNKQSVVNDHIAYLTKYGINLKVEEDLDLPEDHERAKDTLGIISAIEFSSKSGMPNVIKLMIASLPKLNINEKGEKVVVLNNLGLPQLSDYRRTTAILTNELANISSFKEQMYKIRQLSETIPELSLLADQLGVSNSITTPSNLRADYFDLQSKFRQQFDKAYYDFHIQLYDGNNSYLQSSSNDLRTNILARWEGQSFANKKSYKEVDGQKILNAKYFKDKYDKQLKGDEKFQSVLSFYKDLGITFTRPTLVDIDVLADKQKALLKKIENNDISSIFQDEAQSKGFVNAILEQEIKSSLDYSDNQHINPEGKTVYNVSLHNYLSRLAAEINNYGLPKELSWDEETATGNPLLRHSDWKDKINDGKEIKVGILEGARINEQGEDGVSTPDLTYPDAAAQQFVSVLNGISPYMRAGDKSLEHTFTFGNRVNYTSIDDITKYFKGVLADELLSSYMLNVEGVGSEYPEYANGKQKVIIDGKEVLVDVSAKNPRIFKDVLHSVDEKTYQAIINDKTIDRKEAIARIDAFVERDSVQHSLQDWFDNYSKENKQVLLDNNLIYKNEDTYSLVGIPTELADKFVGKSDSLSEVQMQSLVEQFTYNQLLGNIEQIKLFTGDVAFYKDFFKRTSGLTGTGKTAWTGNEVDEWLNENRPREYQDYKGDIKVDKKSDGKIRSLMFKDVKAVSANFKSYVEDLVKSGLDEKYANDILSKYNEAYEEGDAQGYITLPEYREFLTRTGDWTSSHEVLYPKLIRGEKISPEDLSKFLSGYPVLKPQYFGKQTDNDLFVPTFYKFSVMPLIPSVVRGTELEELMHSMLENGNGMSLFQSGNKVGGKTGNDFYDAEGRVNLDTKSLEQQEIYYDNLKIQLDINPKVKDKVIFGTQVRKIVLSNLAGKTITINGKKVEGNRLIQAYSDLIKKSVELEFKKLVDKLGIQPVDDNNYLIKDVNKLKNILQGEALSRQAPDNLLEGLNQVLEEGNIKQFDVLVNRNKIENILMSLVNNSAIKQKVFGDMRVQGASTGFEAKNSKGRGIEDAKKATWWNKVESVDGKEITNLQFYKPTENGTEPMEILLPHYFKELIGKNIKLEDLQEQLQKIIGYRTPTQAPNSVELMRIKGFLPQEAGNLIVVPSEIVVKAGSDFDIDKLTLHLPYYDMVNGEPKYREYKGNEEDLGAIYNRINDISWKILSAPENFRQLITPNTTGDVEKIAKQVKKLKGGDNIADGKGKNIGWKKNLDIREAYLLGKAGIGITALHNVHHILSQIVGLTSKPGVRINLDHLAIESQNKLEGRDKIIEAIKQGLIVPINFKEGDPSARIDLNMSSADKRKAISDINKGNFDTAPASRLIEKVTRMEESDNYPVIEGLGGASIRRQGLTSRDIDNLIKQPNSKQVKISFAGEREVTADPINSETILENLSSFMNGFVDIAKNPFLKDINANVDTAGTYFYLLRAGVPLKQAIMFMNQPIISDYLTEVAKNNSLALKATGNKLSESDLIQKVLDKYPTSYPRIDFNDTKAVYVYKQGLKVNNLQKNIEDYQSSNETNGLQKQMLLDYLQYKDDADKMSDLIKATTADTRGTGSTMNSAQTLIDNFDNIKENSIFENVEKYIDETFVGAFHQAVQNSIKMYSNMFYTEKSQVKEVLSNIKQTANLSKFADVEKVMNLAKNDIINYTLQTNPIENISLMNTAKDAFSGENSVAKLLARAKENDRIANNPLIRELFPIISSNSLNQVPRAKDLDNIKMFSKKLEAADSNIITEGWKELFSTEPELAEKLMLFTVMQSGLNNSPINFTQFVPNEYYVPFANKLLGNASIDVSSFTDKFFRNNYQNDDLVPKIKKVVQTRKGPMEIANGETASVLLPKRNPITGRLLGQDKSNYPFIKAWNNTNKEYELYKNTGIINSDGTAAKFERVSRLGDGYNFKEWTDESIIMSNRVSNRNNPASVLNNIGNSELENLRKNFKDDNNKPIC